MTRTTGKLAENLDAIVGTISIQLDPHERERLRWSLDFAEEFYRVRGRRPIRHVELLKEITKIRDQSEDLLELVGQNQKDLPLMVQLALEPLNKETRKAGFPVNTALQNLRVDLPVIVNAACDAAELLEYQRPKGRGGRRHRGRVPERELIELLVEAYADATGKKPGLSNTPNNGTPTGPLLRFVQCCLQLLGVTKSDDAVYSLVRRIFKVRDS